jgi:transcriptional regulator with XRE-family HTH domain
LAVSWDTPEDREAVAERLRLLEAAVGMLATELADMLGIPKQTYHSWKAGARLPPDAAVVLKKTFGCALDWLYLGDESANTVAFQRKLDQAKKSPPPRGSGRRRKPPKL